MHGYKEFESQLIVEALYLEMIETGQLRLGHVTWGDDFVIIEGRRASGEFRLKVTACDRVCRVIGTMQQKQMQGYTIGAAFKELFRIVGYPEFRR